MKKLLPLILLIPCISVKANTGFNGYRINAFEGQSSMSWKGKSALSFATIKGLVKDDTGQGLVGVTVSVKGTSTRAQTDATGHFAIAAKPGDVLVFSYIGFVQKKVTVEGTSDIVIQLVADAKGLDEVVVTALGVKRSEKSLTYSTQQVSGTALTDVKTDNLMNALSGKVAGLTIAPSASGVGGSSKVILRGNRSLDLNNQPLYVIDGVPISNGGNPHGQPGDAYGGNPEGGDGISNLNPDDIESMTILKGGPAAALYGSAAANGVIVITTKKGKAGKTTINFSSSASIDKAAYQPKLQSSYGQTSPGSTTSFGAPITSAPDNVSQFFQTGHNLTNSLNMSGGTDIAQSYFSYTNTAATGIEPTNKLNRNNLDFHETAKFFNDKLTVDGNINYITQKINNSPSLGYYSNPLTGLYLFPRGQDLSQYKNFEGPNGANGVPTQNWPFQEDIQQNPYWIINRNTNESTRNRILLNASVKYDFTSWLSLQVRGSIDRTNDVGDQKYYAGTLAPLAAPNGNGSWNGYNSLNQQKYADAILTFNVPSKSDWKVDGLLGASVTDYTYTNTSFGPAPQSPYLFGMFVPNLWTIQNIEVAPSNAPNPYASNVSGGTTSENQLQAIFASGNLSYKNWAYLSVSARTDWASNLAFTPTQDYFYPSAGLSFIVSQMAKLPEFISYAKVRGTYAEVGNAPGQYQSNPLNYATANTISFNGAAPYPQLKPERTFSSELGTDLRFFKDRLNFTFTYYNTNTKDQTITITPPATTGFATGYINAGNIQNRGIEVSVGYNMVQNKDFTWNSTVNFSRNKNKVIDIDSKDGIDSVQLTNTSSYRSYVRKGGSYGDIYAQVLQKDAQGRVMLTDDGNPIASNDFEKVGNAQPNFQLGWSNSFSYKNWNVSFLVDGKFGGQVVSVTQSILDAYGVTQDYADARSAGGVKVNGVNPEGKAISSVDAQTWYTTVGGRNAILGQYVYSATTVRLREAAIGYSLPINKSVFKSVRFSLTGRNLLYFYKKAPFDPELTSSTGNGLSGVDIFNQPAVHTYGFKVSASL